MSKIPQWASYMLETYSAGALQAGFIYVRPERTQNRTPDGHWQITTGYKRVRGTGIPASTMAKFKSGQWTPGERTLTKLKSAYRRFAYNELRRQGASTPEAKRITTYHVDDYSDRSGEIQFGIKSAINIYKSQKEDMMEMWDVDEMEMIWSMQLCDMTIDEWEQYVPAEK